ncbi:Na+-transporting NADH:ubiquinone oxidoreductase subunit A [Alkalispirillum mobile]|uniref:Na(+)-translocating NADH-quinone reductase subunit A n=1 Tax=Alkalispirillum mobile TaxID=85925 RepID=A0A498C8H0_9GAMM|nr:Na(+)-translocating NADH-quinone reductase subunit A [Alkalispirillum mobile]RLK51427.1 Na+-transporting NADH:ubiquinone oxidoreductase subunit A [Alkalispirillum mobile]
MIKVRRGLDIPLAGVPCQEVDRGSHVRTVAVLGIDYPGLKPALRVKEGDRVRRGQVLFEDRQLEGVRYTAPGAGRVSAINRGHRRVLLSVVIDLAGGEGDEPFSAHHSGTLSRLGRERVQEQLLASGEWTALRTRPFGKVPVPDSVPDAIFVPAMDTQPLAPDPDVIIGAELRGFRDGLTVLSRLTDGPVWVCRAAQSSLPSFAGEQIREESFAGPHPAGNPGTHIHFLYPVDQQRMVWVVGYQDVIAIGRLFTSGRLYTDRVVALTGPQVARPRLVSTRAGASLEQLTAGELVSDENRVISGSALHGHRAAGPTAYLSRFSNQVTVLREGRERALLGYLSPGFNRHSVMNIYLSRLMPWKRLSLTTSTHGSERAMVPLGQYEEVMPLDILATQLLRALVVGDLETAEALGALELVEEDLALCTYVCAGKYEYGPILRDNLTRLEEEG